ncbi:MAG: redoxin domain-containing protein [Candidatus Limimorpha sp.]
MNTLKNFLMTVLAGLLLASCGGKVDNMCVVKGTVDDPSFEGKTVYMYDYKQKNRYKQKAVDSAVIENGRFLFQDSVQEPFCRYLYVVNDDEVLDIDMFVEEGVVNINLGNGTISGTYLNDRLNNYFSALNVNEVSRLINDLVQEYMATENQGVRDSIDVVYDAITAEYYERLSFNADKMYWDNADNEFGKFLVYEMIDNCDLSSKQLEDYLNAEGSILQQNPEYINRVIDRLRNEENTSKDCNYVDFEGVDFVTGETCRLSDIIGGKFALIDFWASWCGPCKQEVRDNLIRLSEKYAGKLVVVGVDVWDKPDAHAQMVKELGIKYPQLIDNNNVASKLYGFNAIPLILLVGNDGVIIERNIRGEQIEAAIESALSN